MAKSVNGGSGGSGGDTIHQRSTEWQQSCRFHQYLLAESKLIPSLLFHCRLRRKQFWNATVFFSLEKKRNNVQDSDNSDFYIIVLILTLTHTPEEARSANVVSTEGEMFIVADTDFCFLSIVYGWRYYLCAEGIIYVSYSYVHTSTFVLDLAGLLCILRTFSPNRAAGVAFLPRVRAGLYNDFHVGM